MIRKLMVILLTGVFCLLGITSALALEYSEAPMLRTLVAAGELPPVEERLPEEPQVVKPVEKIGQYGGTLRVVDSGGNSINAMGAVGLFAVAQDFEAGTHDYYEGLVKEKSVPSFAKGSEFSNDKKTLTLYLRKGVRWSDGAPLTADDLLFWYEDVIKNKELTPVIDSFLKPGGELMEIEKVNDYTIRFHFSEPYEIFKTALEYWCWEKKMVRPKHYFSQFHIKYNPEADELAKKAGFDNWWNLFLSKTDWIRNPDYPVFSPWKTVEFKPERWIGERNPYFWRVDTAGNQLPYIDRVVCELSPNMEVQTMKIIAGQVDFAAMALPFTEIPLFKANEEQGNYRTVLWDSPEAAMGLIALNQTYKKDPILGEIFRDVRFRQALSLAINREEANEVAYFGVSYPTQYTCIPESKFFEPEFATAYAEYSPEKANQLLDEMGLKWDKDHQWRLKKDGESLTIVVETFGPGWLRGYAKIRPLLKEYWENVGVRIVLKSIDWNLFIQRKGANQIQMTIYSEDEDDLSYRFMRFPYFIVGQWYSGWYAPLWNLWVTSEGKSGEEPPEEVKKARELWLQMRRTEDKQEKIRLGKEAFSLQAKNLWLIGVVGSVARPSIVSNNLRNFPENMVWSTSTTLTSYSWPFQWFFEK